MPGGAGRPWAGGGAWAARQPPLWQGWLWLYCGLGLGGKKTSWAKSPAVGCRLSLLPCIFSPLKHPLLGPTQMSCSHRLPRAAQLQSQQRTGLFNFGSLGYCFPLSNQGEKGKSCISYKTSSQPTNTRG